VDSLFFLTAAICWSDSTDVDGILTPMQRCKWWERHALCMQLSNKCDQTPCWVSCLCYSSVGMAVETGSNLALVSQWHPRAQLCRMVYTQFWKNMDNYSKCFWSIRYYFLL